MAVNFSDHTLCSFRRIIQITGSDSTQFPDLRVFSMVSSEILRESALFPSGVSKGFPKNHQRIPEENTSQTPENLLSGASLNIVFHPHFSQAAQKNHK